MNGQFREFNKNSIGLVCPKYQYTIIQSELSRPGAVEPVDLGDSLQSASLKSALHVEKSFELDVEGSDAVGVFQGSEPQFQR